MTMRGFIQIIGIWSQLFPSAFEGFWLDLEVFVQLCIGSNEMPNVSKFQV